MLLASEFPVSLPSMNAPTPAPEAQNPVQSARELLKNLQQRFEVFRTHQPLSIGIDKQIIALEPEINRKVLRIALGLHTRSTPYLKALEKAPSRFDLEGKPAGEIPDEHRARAGEMLKERFRKNAEQRKAQREAQRQAEEAEKAERRRAEKLNQLAAKFSRQK